MLILVDNHIPYVRGLLEEVARVRYLPAAEMTPEAVGKADALLVRTRTRCDAALLGASRVRFIGSATIGVDHIDLPWCRSRGIAVCNAPGCNAPAVAQWTLAAIAAWMRRRDSGQPAGLTLGVVGVGHVGGIVARWAAQLGFKVLLNDPPLAAAGRQGLVGLDELLAGSDIVTVHTPLTREGRWPTWHLIDDTRLRQMGRCRLLLNAARGGIVDDDALSRWPGDAALDCWEGEPSVHPTLLRRALVATPHIAGYSAEGKQRGTAMVLEALGRHFGWNVSAPMPDAPAGGATSVTLDGVLASFDPALLTQRLKERPGQFDSLRDRYPLRSEYQGVEK